MEAQTGNNLRVLLTLLGIAVLLADVAALAAWNVDEYVFQDWRTLSTVALALSQISLAAIWGALANVAAGYRWIPVVVHAAYWTIGFSRRGDIGSQEWPLLIIVQTLSVCLMLFAMRFAGWQVSRWVAAESILASGRNMQFSLRQIFIWTTLAALLAVAPRFLNIDRSNGLTLTMFAVVFATIGVLSAWTILSITRLYLRLVLLLTYSSLIGGLVFYWLAADASAWRGGAKLCALQCLLIAVVLALFRSAGYRLVRQSR